MAARSRNENPAASAMPTIAAVTGSRTSAPVRLITPTKKHTAEPKTRSAAPRNIRIAMTVTPMGRCMLPPFDHRQHGWRGSEVGCFWLGKEYGGEAGISVRYDTVPGNSWMREKREVVRGSQKNEHSKNEGWCMGAVI